MLSIDLKKGEILTFSPVIFHETYAGLLEAWTSCRDAYAGSLAIKRTAEQYLPRLSGHKVHEKLGITKKEADEAYLDYKNRATWYGATQTTVNAYRGMITRKPPVYTMEPEGKREQFDNLMTRVTLEGQTSEDFISNILQEILVVNKVGVLEDFPEMVALDEDGNLVDRVVSQLEYEQEGFSSYSSLYRAEAIINWTFAEVNGKKIPTTFVLTEWEEQSDISNPFVSTYVPVYRVLELVEIDGQMVYRQVVLKERTSTESSSGTPAAAGGIPALSGGYTSVVPGIATTASDFEVADIIYPLLNGEYMTEIPFKILTHLGADMVSRPPLIMDLVEMNLGHYRNSADQEHELHTVTVKTAVYPGWDTEEFGQPVQGQAITCPPDQKPFIMEATGTSTIGKAMNDKETLMAVLGAQMLGSQGRYVQSSETATINNMGESSILAQLATSLSTALSELFTFKTRWSLVDPEVKVTVVLNTDFFENQITGQELTSWVQSLQAGAVSPETYYYNLKRREAYQPNWSFDDEMNALDAAGMGTSNAAAILMELERRLNKLETAGQPTESESIVEGV